MQKSKGKCLLVMAVIMFMLVVPVQPLITNGEGSMPTMNLSIDSDDKPYNPLTEANQGMDFEENDINESLTVPQKRIGGDGYVKVIVATTDIRELGIFLEKHNYRGGKIGRDTSKGMAFPILDIPAPLVSKIEQLEHVVGVYPYQNPVLGATDSNDPIYPHSSGGGIAQPFDVGTYSGRDVKVAVVDTGVDFGHPEMSDKYAVAPDVDFTINDEIVIENSDGNITQAMLIHTDIIASSYVVKMNGTDLTETTDYTLDIATGQITFTNTNVVPVDSEVTANYTYHSSYAGWPIAFDSASMKEFIDSEAKPGGCYVNTSYNGTGPFEDVHILTVDGEKDFGEAEKIAADYHSLDVISPPPDYNVDDLYVTRDLENIYLGLTTFTGIPTSEESEKIALANMSYGIYIDVDGPASGGEYDPKGNHIDTNASHANHINAVAYSPDGSMIASAAGGRYGGTYYRDTSVKIWSASTGVLLKTLEGHTTDRPPMSLAWNSNGDMVASADSAYVYLWDVNTGEMIGDRINYAVQEHPLSGVELHNIISINKNGSMIAIGGQDSVGFYDLPNGDYIKNYSLPAGFEAHSLAFNPNGTLLAVALSDDTIRVFNVSTEVSYTCTGHIDNVYSLAWNSDGTEFATGSRDLTIRIWQLGNPIATDVFNNPNNYTNSIVWSPDDSKLATATSYTSSANNKVQVWDIPSGTILKTFDLTQKVNSVDWSGDLIVSGSEDTKVRTWDVSDPDENNWAEEMVFRGYLPDYAIYLNHVGVEWGVDSEGEIWSSNDTFSDWMLYKWDDTDSEWKEVFGVYNETFGIDTRTDPDAVLLANNTLYKDGKYYEIPSENNTIMYDGNLVELSNTTGKLGYSGYLDYAQSGFLEFGIDRDLIGNPWTMNLTLFTTNDEPSHVQDIVPSDPNIEFDKPDFYNPSYGPNTTSLVAFAQYTPDILPVKITDVSQSGTYYSGNHPDKNLIMKFGSVGMLLVDTQEPGKYDRLYIDGNYDKVYDDNDVYIDISTPANQYQYFDPVAEKNFTYSTGLLYFIADGRNPIPYSDVYAERYGVQRKNFTRDYIPKNGEILCLMGEFNLDTVHGTKTASAITTRAENATIIPIGDVNEGNYFDSLYFAAEGYDGVVGTDDDAHLVSIGINYPNQDTGWDIYSKFTDWISTIYTSDNLVCVASVGDGGFGYGSVLSPATGPSVIGVGSATDYKFFETEDTSGPNYHQGDVYHSSSKGPSVLGLPKPDVINYGVANVSIPLRKIPQGDLNYTVWDGSDAAAALTVGDLALIYEAYFDETHFIENEFLIHATMNLTEVSLRHSPVVSCTIKKNDEVTTAYTIDLNTGTITFDENITAGDWVNATYSFNNDYPDVPSARSLLMSATDDVYNDVLTQGAGIVNLGRSIGIANGTAGLTVTPSIWVPGDFEGDRYESFVNLMHPGETDTIEFTVENPSSGTISAKITDSHFEKIGEYSYSHLMKSQNDMEHMFINSTGIYKVVGSGADAELQMVMTIDPAIWYSAQLMKIDAYADWNLVYNQVNGDIIHNYALGTFDWTNIENDLLDLKNLNQMSCSMCGGMSSNLLEGRVFDPARRIHDGLVVKLKHNPQPYEAPLNISWQVSISFYNRTDWDWLSLDTTDVSIVSTPTKNTNSICATIDLPNDVNIGSYEGAVRLTYDEQTVTNEIVLANALEGTIAVQLAHQDITEIEEIKINSIIQLPSNYTLDEQSGTIIFNSPLSSGDDINANYIYFTASIIIPVFVNIDPTSPGCTFGGPTIMNVYNETVTDVETYSETDEWLFEVEKHSCHETIIVPTYSITNELLVNNANRSVTGEPLSVYWDNVETAYVAWFDYCRDDHSVDGLDYAIVDDPANYPVKIYNGTELLVEGDDYTVYLGDVNNGGGLVTFLNPIDLTDTFIADYSYYRCNLQEVLLETEDYVNEVINGSTIKLFWKDGTEIPRSGNWSWDDVANKITFAFGPFNDPVPAGEIITTDYTYYRKIQYYLLKFDTALNASTAVIQSSCILYKDGEKMLEGSDYQFLQDGRIKFLGSAILIQGDIVLVDYKYYHLYKNWSLDRGGKFNETIVNGSYTIYNNLAPFSKTKYTIDCKNGNITFNVLPQPGDNLTISYRFYNATLYNLLYANIEDSPYGFNYGLLDHNNIVAGSQEVKKKAGATWDILRDGIDYKMDFIHGTIQYKTSISPIDEIKVTYAYTDTSALLFNPNGISGGNDRRFYYINVPDEGLNRNQNNLIKLCVDVKWDFKPSDIDIAIWGVSTHPPTIPSSDEDFPSDRYGEISIEELEKSGYSPTFLTATNESNELLVTTLRPGLNVIELNGVILNGTMPYETIDADVGLLYVSKETISVYTQDLSGKASISIVSTMDWPGTNVSALGPAIGKMYKDQEVYRNDPAWGNYKSFQEQLAIGQLEDEPLYTMAVKVKNAATLEVHIWGHDDCPDLDLGVFLDGKDGSPEDGIIQTEEFVDLGADWDADEEVLLVNPEDGTYLIRVFGFTVSPTPGHFDMKISMILAGVEGYGMEGTGEDTEPANGIFTVNTTIPAFTLQTFNITWNFPGDTTDDEFGGVVYIGPSNAPEVLSIIAKIVIDREAPVIKEITLPLNGAIINDNKPIVSAKIEDSVREEIDADSIKLFVDGTDVTSLAKVSVDHMSDTGGSGYPQGTVTYTPNVMLSEGGHIVELKASDWAGNEVTRKWSFTVDTKKPVVSLDSLSDVTYTNQASIVLQGTTEQDASVDVMIGALSVDVKRDAVGGFTATIDLFEGVNTLMVTAIDAGGNEERRIVTIIVDMETPVFDRLKCLDGTVTNQASTALSGSMSEKGTLTINGDPTTVNSDGTFTKYIDLMEGNNLYALEFTDLAGNPAYKWFNVTLDTQAPIINIDAFETNVGSNSFDLSGTTEAGAYVKVNGKLVQVSGTRQQTGSFNKSITLSPGANTLVIESEDAAGNINQEYITVTYDGSGTNYGAIGLMVLLLIVGLLVGIFLARIFFEGPAEEDEVPDEEVPPLDEDTDMEGEPLDADEVPPLDEDMDMEGEPLDADDVPPLDEDIDMEGEPLDADEVPPLDEDIADEPEEYPEPEEIEDVPPMEDEVPPLEEDISETDDAPEPEPVDEAPEEVAPAETDEDDPRVTKLTEAYEDGKISKELYEKNLAKFKGE